MTCFVLSGIIRVLTRLNAVSEEKQVSYKMFLSESLRAKFKSLCALKGVSMNQTLVELVERWIEENEKRPVSKD